MSERGVLDSIGDGITVRRGYGVSLDLFEGPLDLLLHLVRRHELDVLDIPIAFVTEKYVEYLEFARALDIEIAGEYLVMAATLAYLKSRELLPPEPEDLDEADEGEEGADPRAELIRRLIEYERFRSAAEQMDARPIEGRDVFVRGTDEEIDLSDRGLAPMTLFRLAEAYNRVIDRARIHAEHEVELDPISIQERMQQLGLMFREAASIDFEAMFLSRTWRSERELRGMLVVTLMSVLEMVKLGLLSIHQPADSATLLLERQVDAAEMEGAIAGYREDDEVAAGKAEMGTNVAEGRDPSGGDAPERE